MLVVHSGHVLEFVVFRMRFLSSLTFVVPLCVAHVRSTLPFSPVMFHLGVLLLYGVNCGVTFNYVPLSLILLNSVCACGGCSPPARGGFLEASTKSKAIGGCRALRGDILPGNGVIAVCVLCAGASAYVSHKHEFISL